MFTLTAFLSIFKEMCPFGNASPAESVLVSANSLPFFQSVEFFACYQPGPHNDGKCGQGTPSTSPPLPLSPLSIPLPHHTKPVAVNFDNIILPELNSSNNQLSTIKHVCRFMQIAANAIKGNISTTKQATVVMLVSSSSSCLFLDYLSVKYYENISKGSQRTEWTNICQEGSKRRKLKKMKA